MSAEKTPTDIADKLKKIRNKIATACEQSGRTPSEVRLVGVTKQVPFEKIREAFQAGLTDFGENYAQEALPKVTALSEANIRWHFIGALQSNKVKQIHDRFSLIHSVERISTLIEISKRTERTQDVLIEVNLTHEPTKSGVFAEDVAQLIEDAQKLPNIRLCGLMFMPPIELVESGQRRYFHDACKLRDRLVTNVTAPHNLRELSMGTSHDFEAAIKEGATLVRVGSAIFGARQYPAGGHSA